MDCVEVTSLQYSQHTENISGVSNRSIFTIGFLFYTLMGKIFIIALIYQTSNDQLCSENKFYKGFVSLIYLKVARNVAVGNLNSFNHATSLLIIPAYFNTNMFCDSLQSSNATSEKKKQKQCLIVISPINMMNLLANMQIIKTSNH